MTLTDKIKTRSSELGADLVGIADLSTAPEETLRGFPVAVSVGIRIPVSNVEELIEKGYRIAHSDGPQYVALMDLARILNGELESKGYKTEIPHATNQGTISHRAVAARAGLGWVGKCSLVVTPEFGSAVRFVSILTDAPLDPDEPVLKSECGSCHVCRDACLKGAPGDILWEEGMGVYSLFDIDTCASYKKELEEKNNTCCQVCMGACPYTRKYIKRVKGLKV